jgi:mannose-6-phosphate isomerase
LSSSCPQNADKRESCNFARKICSMQSLYPFTFSPVYKDKIWGGQKIRKELGMDFGELVNCGEAWLLSGVHADPTLIANGYLAGNELNELVEVFMGDLVGEAVYERFGDIFPILVKIIDSNDWLSIQVHPDDKLAQRRGIGMGKTEMWYVMQADQDAALISGFNQQLNKQDYLDAMEKGQIKSLMNYEQVAKGDVFYMPAGRVHALGPGTLIAEIQQTSDTTYRIYDWDRIDHAGQKRALHTEEALDAIDFELPDETKTTYAQKTNETSNIVKSPFFTTNYLQFDQGIRKDYSQLDSFVILLCVEGSCTIDWGFDEKVEIKKGQSVLIPNVIQAVALYPKADCTLLEVYIE